MALAAMAILGATACSSQSDTSTTDIQASVALTSDVAKIDITVHQLSNGALLYYSGKQDVDSTTFPNRKSLERSVKLPASTDMLFDASAYDVDGNLVAVALTIQQSTQPPGVDTQVLIVIDLNPTQNGGNNSGTDITAVTDNIPVLVPPQVDTLPSIGGHITLTYQASDADWPGDPMETMTFFSTILTGNVTPDPGDADLFAQGSTFGFTFNDDQEVQILCGVVDRFHQAGYAVIVLDPSTGLFQVTEQTEGYAIMVGDDGSTGLPRLAHHDDPASTPTNPPPASGTVVLAVVRHGMLNTTEIDQAINRADDSTQVTPLNEAIWQTGTGGVRSFNKYVAPTQPGMPTSYVYKLRVELIGSGAETAPDQVNDIIDTMTFGGTASVFGFVDQAEEPISGIQETIDVPAIVGAPASTTVAPGAQLTYNATGMAGLSVVYFEGAANDPLLFADFSETNGTPDSVTITVPADAIPTHTYTVHYVSFGRITGTSPTQLTISGS